MKPGMPRVDVRLWKKTLCISGYMQFKPMLSKGQLNTPLLKNGRKCVEVYSLWSHGFTFSHVREENMKNNSEILSTVCSETFQPP